MQPREWGELVHQILSKIRFAEEVESVLKPYLNDASIDAHDAEWIRTMFKQMTQHPQIGAAFEPTAKVKTECEILDQGQVMRLDRYSELPDVVYLLDYKTGKENNDYKEKIREYVSAVKNLTTKEVKPFLVYLSEETVDVVLV